MDRFNEPVTWWGLLTYAVILTLVRAVFRAARR
jgi:hypothetical protein